MNEVGHFRRDISLIAVRSTLIMTLSPLIDRLLHYSLVFQIDGDSYRLKDKGKAGVIADSAPTEQLGGPVSIAEQREAGQF